MSHDSSNTNTTVQVSMQLTEEQKVKLQQGDQRIEKAINLHHAIDEDLTTLKYRDGATLELNVEQREISYTAKGVMIDRNPHFTQVTILQDEADLKEAIEKINQPNTQERSACFIGSSQSTVSRMLNMKESNIIEHDDEDE